MWVVVNSSLASSANCCGVFAEIWLRSETIGGPADFNEEAEQRDGCFMLKNV